MRYLLFLITLSIGYLTHAQSTKKLAKDTLIWRADSLLTVEHFQAKRNNVKGAFAYTTTTIWLYQREVGGELLFFVDAIMLKSKSFLPKDVPYTLNHEQKHFDLCEVYARKIRQKIAEKDFTKVKDTPAEINKIYNKLIAEYFKEQEKFDKETEHGINAAKQQIWNEKIAGMLADLEAYSSNSVSITK
ncbi:MAG: DUF922 domain-containing protein [Bacteroidetes bacterium]|nr:MAG: DUF922 domain-containing protein [Bacteroidota bacterium]